MIIEKFLKGVNMLKVGGLYRYKHNDADKDNEYFVIIKKVHDTFFCITLCRYPHFQIESNLSLVTTFELLVKCVVNRICPLDLNYCWCMQDFDLDKNIDGYLGQVSDASLKLLLNNILKDCVNFEHKKDDKK